MKESVLETSHNFKFSSKWAVCTESYVGIIWTMLSLFIGNMSWSMELPLGNGMLVSVASKNWSESIGSEF